MKLVKLVPLIIFASLIVIVTQITLFQSGLPVTHDSQSHLARFANYYVATKQGQIPPRIAPGLNNGFGYPVFNFNYPFPNLVALPMIILNLSVQNSLKLQLIVSAIIGVIACFWWLKPYFGKRSSLVAAAYYGLSPYLLSLIYVRGVIGEQWAYSLFPIILGLVDRVLRKSKWINWYQIGLIIVGSMFLISHNIIVMLSILPMAAYAAYKSRSDFSKLKYLLLPLLVSILISSFFWIPALAEKHFTNLDKVPLSNQIENHFIRFDQLFFARIVNGFSRQGPVDGMSFGIGIGSWIAILMTAVVWVKKRFMPRYIGILLILLSCLLLLMTKYSSEIWRVVPGLNYVQFPWRLGFFVPLIISILLAWLLALARNKWVEILVLVLLLIGAFNLNTSESRFDFDDDYWFSYSQTTSILDENMPIWFDKHKNYELVENKFITKQLFVDDFDEINTLQLSGGKVDLEVTTTNQQRVVHRIAYFPGWNLSINGEPAEIDYNNKDYPGLITYLVQPGQSYIKLRFMQNTWPRYVGNGLSVVGFLIITSILVYEIKSKKK